MTSNSSQRLAIWMRPVVTGQERLAGVRDGLAALPSLSIRKTMDLVGLAHGVEDAASAEMLRLAISEHDLGFGGRAVDRETQIVAALAVADQLDGEDPVWAALAVLSAQFVGLTPAASELVPLAVEGLATAAETARLRETLPKPKLTDPYKNLDWADGRAVTGTDLQELLETVKASHKSWQSGLRALADSAQRQIGMRDEEIEFLSWALSGRVDGDGDAYDTLGTDASLVAAVDIHSRLANPAVPAGVEGLLRRVLPDAPVALGAAVGKAATAIELPVGGRHALTPLLNSVDAAVELEGAASWKALAEKRSQLKLSTKHPPIDVANQFVRELILATEIR